MSRLFFFMCAVGVKHGVLTRYRTLPDATRLWRPFMTSSTEVSKSHYGGNDQRTYRTK